jgi:hypothetical protein
MGANSTRPRGSSERYPASGYRFTGNMSFQFKKEVEELSEHLGENKSKVVQRAVQALYSEHAKLFKMNT